MPWPPGLGVIIIDYPPFVIREVLVVIIVFTAYFSSFVFVIFGVLGIGGGALGFFEGLLCLLGGIFASLPERLVVLVGVAPSSVAGLFSRLFAKLFCRWLVRVGVELLPSFP